MIKKYNEFINEGIVDLLSGYSMNEVKEKLNKLTPIERYKQLNKLELKYEDLYTQDEIDNLTNLDKIYASNKYDWIGVFINNTAKVEIDGKYGIIDENGNEIIPVKYNYINGNGFEYDITTVLLNNKYGYIDINGKKITPIKYDFAYGFKNGKGNIELNGKIGYVDKDGNEYWN